MRYDLHTHTKYSKCSALKPEILLKIARKKGLDGIAVTDHNTMIGAKEARKLNKDDDFEVILASEIRTDYGDVLIYYLEEEINSKELFTVLDKAKEQDAIVSIAHPFRPFKISRFNYPIKDISDRINAIECVNARTFYWENNKANNIANELKLAKTAGSDAHFSLEVGNAVTVFDGDLRKAIKKRSTTVEGRSLVIPLLIALSGIKKRI